MSNMAALARRIYTDLVRRRSTVRIVPAAEPSLASRPIFLIGQFRSGTTLLRYLLDSHSQIACGPESDFLAALRQVVDEPRSAFGLESLGFDEEHLRLRLRAFSSYFFESYAQSRSKPRWADKSPLYVDHVDFLRWLYPEAQFILLHRFPLDQIHSHTRGGTYAHDPLQPYVRADEDLRISGARYWSEKARALLVFEQSYPADTIRIRYEDLCERPEEVLQSLFSFLDEDWEPGVLKLDEFDHDHGREAGSVAASKTISRSGGHYRSWPPEVIAASSALTRVVAEELGYVVPPADTPTATSPSAATEE